MHFDISKNTQQDILPTEVWKWTAVEKTIHETMELNNYKEIRTSIVQSQDLFKSYLSFFNEHFDYSKQFLFSLNEQQNLSLRPEGTITVLQNFIKSDSQEMPQRLYYIGPMFRRKNNAQLVQFHQLGVELIGNVTHLADNEILLLGQKMFHRLGLHQVKIELSSFGCEVCRPRYIQEMKNFVQEEQDHLCPECQYQTQINPLQILQCINTNCQKLSEKSPNVIELLCPDCSKSFKNIQRMLSNLGIIYSVNPYMPSSFNYYNQTVFNFIYEIDNKKVILGNGGRYDLLSKSIIGKDMPAIGFSANMDNIIQLLSDLRLISIKELPFRVTITPMAKNLELVVLQIIQELHEHNIHTEIIDFDEDYKKINHKLDNSESQVVIFITEEMIRDGKVSIKNFIKDYQEVISIGHVSEYLIRLKKAIGNI